MAFSPELEDRLSSSARFALVWAAAESSLRIFAVRPRPGHPPPAALIDAGAPAAASLDRADPEHLEFTVTLATAGDTTIATAWSPKWHGVLDSGPAELERTNDGLIALRLPAGTSHIRLDYRADRWDRVGRLIALATFGAGCAWPGWRRRVRVHGQK